MIPVADGVAVSARLYPKDRTSPVILFFHGNGEIACQYDDIAPYYHRAGASLLVADFRGYGRSTGAPTFSTMVADASAVYRWARTFLAEQGYTGAVFVKGRSLGSHSALELAARFGGELRGLISESGASALERLAARFGVNIDTPAVREALRAHRAKVAAIALPLLVIHGEWDELIPVETAVDLYDTVASSDKTMEIIPGAGHNDLLWVGLDQYFAAVAKFIAEHAGDGVKSR